MLRFTSLIFFFSWPTALFAETLKVDPAADWPWWRGPTRDNRADAAAKPVVQFSETENVLWKTPVPGRGHASPTVVGNRVILATSLLDSATQAVVAFHRETGQRLWQHAVNRGNLPDKIHAKNTHASSTVASDGERVFAVFYNKRTIQVAAIRLDGTPVWERRVGPFFPKKYEFGYAASPLIYGDYVVVIGDQVEGGFLVALDRKTGEVKWRAERPNDINYASPIVATLQGRDQILVGGCGRIMAYDPLTGASLWEAESATPPQTCGTVVWDKEANLVFASGGYPNKMTSAVRAGTGEVVWENNKKCYEQSMLTHAGHLYAINDSGIAHCWRAADGEEKWFHRLKGPISASPVLVGDRIYAVNERGRYFVFRARADRFEQIAENQLGDEAFATPAIVGDRIFARVAFLDDAGERSEMLYCLGE